MVLITGASGRLGKQLQKDWQGGILLTPSSSALNITDKKSVDLYFEENQIDSVIHCAAYTDVRGSAEDFQKCLDVNVIGTLNLVNACAKRSIKLIYISTDYVFDGRQGPYEPDDAINPITVYAKSKAAGELCVRCYPHSLVIRTSFFDTTFPYDVAVADQYTSKDYVDIISPKILKTIRENERGVVHVGSSRRSIYDIAITRKPNVKKIYREDLPYLVPQDTSFKQEP
jgi:dTDP-4-dehydrorhamnose reductase